MTRAQLEHVIRAACAVAQDNELIVMGSQAILGQYPDAPADFTVSMEADVLPKNHPERALLIEGALGELSMFHETFGYFVDGLEPPYPTLPEGWADRLTPICSANTHHQTGWCLDLHDLLVSKYIAGREKDRTYCAAAARLGYSDATILRARLGRTKVDEHRRAAARAAIERDFGAG